MRILTLTQFYPPIIGGEEEHARLLSHALARRGHRVAVATLWHEGLPEFEVEADGVRVYRLRSTTGRLTGLFANGGRRHAPPMPDPEATLALRRIIARERPQIVHAHNWLTRSFLPLKAWSGAKLIVTLHNYNLVCAKNTLMRDGAICAGPAPLKCLGCASHHYGLAKGAVTTLGAFAFSAIERRLVDAYIPVSRAVASSNQLARGPAAYRIIPTMIPDPARAEDTQNDEETFAPYLAQLPQRPFMLFVGALGKFKGVEVTLQAHAGLVDAPPLVLIGYPMPDVTLPTPQTHPNVVVLRDWPRLAVMAAWRRCLFGLVPSVWAEPGPTVALEVMAAGKALIASRIGGLLDKVVEGETGLLTQPGDVTALRAAMQRLLDDPALCHRMGVAGQRRARNYYASAIAARVERVYQDALGDDPSTALAVPAMPVAVPLRRPM